MSVESIKILLIDDNVDFAVTMSMALEYFGNKIHIANTGKEGISKFSSERPNVVICDIGLPDISGYEVVAEIRRLHDFSQELPLLIALSGYAQDKDKLQAKNAGFDKYFTKPINLEDLIDLLH